MRRTGAAPLAVMGLGIFAVLVFAVATQRPEPETEAERSVRQWLDRLDRTPSIRRGSPTP